VARDQSAQALASVGKQASGRAAHVSTAAGFIDAQRLSLERGAYLPNVRKIVSRSARPPTSSSSSTRSSTDA
jgi:hypothetical protein